MITSAFLSQIFFMCIGPGDSENAHFLELEKQRQQKDFQDRKEKDPKSKIKPPPQMTHSEQELETQN